MQYLPSDPWSQANQRTDNGPGAALAGIGNVFGDPMQNALQQQKQALTAREIAGQGQLGALFAHPGAANTATGAAAIANGMTPDAVGQAIRLTNNLNGGVDSDLAARAATGIGAYNNTPLSQQRAEQAHMAETQQAADIAARSQLRVAGLEPVQITNPDGSTGWTTKAAISQGQAPAGAQPLISPEMVKGAIESHNLLPQPGAAPGAPAPDGSGMSSDQRTLVMGADTAPKFQVVGEDSYGNKTYGYPPAPPAAGAAPAAPAAPTSLGAGNLSGGEFLKTQNPADVPLIQGIARGDIQPPPASTRQGRPNPLLAAVMSYDPTFNAQDTMARFKLKQEAGSLKGNGFGAQVNAGQLAIGHLGKLSDLVDGLQNSNVLLYNSVRQAGGSAIGGQVPYNVFKAEIPQLANEITKLYAGSEGSEAARQRIIDALNPNMSPAQLNSSLAGILGQIQEKVGNLQHTWTNTMGSGTPEFPIILPNHQKIMDAVTARAAAQPTGLAAPPAVPGTLPPAGSQSITLPGVTTPPTQGAFDGPVTPVGQVKAGKGGKSYIRLPGGEFDASSWKAVPSGGQ